MRARVALLAVSISASLLFAATGSAQTSFVEFESGPVRPIALSPDGSLLFAVNTPDNRLEVFAVSGGSLTHTDSIPVGMEPVAVAARSNDEVWVVNHLSDSVSVIDLTLTPMGVASPTIMKTASTARTTGVQPVRRRTPPASAAAARASTATPKYP